MKKKDRQSPADVVLLPGDGIGPEVISAAKRVLNAVEDRRDFTFQIREHIVGGVAIDATGQPLPGATLQACREADGVLLGAVGGPKWDDPAADVRPEQGLLRLRKELDLFANLRPVQPHPALLSASPLKAERLQDVDLIVVRELTGGVYFGRPRERTMIEGVEGAVDTMIYSVDEVRRIAHIAFGLARHRRGKVTSVDKANVLESSRLWREVVNQVGASYPEVELETLLVDAATMHLLSRPASFDVLVTANMFGDILSDEASVLTGSLGTLPSASVGEELNRFGNPRGVYEPIHGSAPDIAGKGVANPIGAILSVAMFFRHSLGFGNAARAVEKAVDEALRAGSRTVDLAGPEEDTLTTDEMVDAVVSYLR